MLEGDVTALGFDFGLARIGVAVGQTLTQTASPLPPLKAQQGTPDWSLVMQLIDTWRPQRLIVGLPLNMDGSKQPLTTQARLFGNQLSDLSGLDTHYEDERQTTLSARQSVFEQGGYRALQGHSIDSQAAVLILESWLQSGHK